MEDQNVNENETSEPNIGIVVAQSFVISAAAVAGMLTGLIAVGKTIEKVQEHKLKKAKKIQQEFDKKFNEIINNQ